MGKTTICGENSSSAAVLILLVENCDDEPCVDNMAEGTLHGKP